MPDNVESVSQLIDKLSDIEILERFGAVRALYSDPSGQVAYEKSDYGQLIPRSPNLGRKLYEYASSISTKVIPLYREKIQTIMDELHERAKGFPINEYFTQLTAKANEIIKEKIINPIVNGDREKLKKINNALNDFCDIPQGIATQPENAEIINTLRSKIQEHLNCQGEYIPSVILQSIADLTNGMVGGKIPFHVAQQSNGVEIDKARTNG